MTEVQMILIALPILIITFIIINSIDCIGLPPDQIKYKNYKIVEDHNNEFMVYYFIHASMILSADLYNEWHIGTFLTKEGAEKHIERDMKRRMNDE